MFWSYMVYLLLASAWFIVAIAVLNSMANLVGRKFFPACTQGLLFRFVALIFTIPHMVIFVWKTMVGDFELLDIAVAGLVFFLLYRIAYFLSAWEQRHFRFLTLLRGAEGGGGSEGGNP